jgi:hypothetical protein
METDFVCSSVLLRPALARNLFYIPDAISIRAFANIALPTEKNNILIVKASLRHWLQVPNHDSLRRRLNVVNKRLMCAMQFFSK